MDTITQGVQANDHDEQEDSQLDSTEVFDNIIKVCGDMYGDDFIHLEKTEQDAVIEKVADNFGVNSEDINKLIDSDAVKIGGESQDSKTKEDKKDEPKVDKRFTRKLGTPEQIKEAQNNAGKMDIISFNDYIKHFTVDALVALADAAGIKNWDSISNEQIRKMRLLMEIKAFYYPQDKTPVKPSSEWRKVALADLLSLAKKNKLNYKKSNDEKIQRMWVIMAIKAANLTPQDLPQKKGGKANKSKQVVANV